MLETEANPDLTKICRLCLQRQEVYFDIFDTSKSEISIPMRIMTCAAVEVKSTDDMPKQICSECRYQLEKSFLFRKRSQAADVKLRKHIRLLNSGKPSRVFIKNEDDSDEEESEYEDSINFLKKQDALKSLHEDNWRTQYKKSVLEEYTKKLNAATAAQQKAMLSQVTERVQSELRDAKIKLRQQITEQVRREVSDKCRKEGIASIIRDIETYLNGKKAKERLGSEYIIEKAAQDAKILPNSKHNRRSQVNAIVHKEQNAPTTNTEAQKKKLSENDELTKEYQSTNTETEQEMNDVGLDGDNNFYIIENEKFTSKPEIGENHVDEPQTDSLMDTSNDKTKNGQVEETITSYQIKDNGEIQFCEKRRASATGKQRPEVIKCESDVVMLDINETYNAGELVEYVNLDGKIIYLNQDGSDDQEDADETETKKTEMVTDDSNGENNSSSEKDEIFLPMPQRVTDTVKTFSCEICPINFSTANSLDRHMRTHFKLEKKGVHYQCCVCQVYLSCGSALKRHMVIHTGKRPYKCEECGKSFVQREILKRHMDIHTGVKPFKCTHCNRTFAQKINLQAHINKLHNMEQKWYNCHICPKKFTHSSGLSRHLTSHAGIAYECKECNREFQDRSSAKRHTVKTHGFSGKNIDDIINVFVSKQKLTKV